MTLKKEDITEIRVRVHISGGGPFVAGGGGGGGGTRAPSLDGISVVPPN